MGFSDLWSRTLVYFGIAEEEEWDESGYATNEQLEESYNRRDRQNVRRLPKTAESDDWASAEDPPARSSRRQPRLRSVDPPAGESPPRRSAKLQRRPADRRPLQGVGSRDPQPAECGHGSLQAADRLRERPDVRARRQHAGVADKVFLLTPRDVELSAEERARVRWSGAASTTRRRGGESRNPLARFRLRNPWRRPLRGRRSPLYQGDSLAAKATPMGVPASFGLLFDTASQLQSFVRVFVDLHPAHLRVGHPVLGSTPVFQHGRNCARFLDEVVVPYLRLFRWLPRLGPFDLSPIVGRRRPARCGQLV